ncbi:MULTISPECIES: hypothetical protein [Methanobacterium]|uniref:Lipoprotein n=1 Tax=Methanobacterium veterum TaxID=408577 RepID=A0A9E5DM26_9EURY|nr:MULTISPECIES: hypothetical protein [Methanobacterium]MCZ3366562.1 hypothetical protein [Methanobacterium veterum]MCZ3374294.1 hypothetical protein [Methanobacterium veterum]
MSRINKYLSIILIFAVIFTSGCVNTQNNSTGNNTNQSPNTNNSSFTPNVIVTVAYQGSWNGTISDNTGNRTVQGTSSNNYNLGPNPGTVSVTFRKTDNRTLPLRVQIFQGNKVIESQSTNESFGTVSISHIF